MQQEEGNAPRRSKRLSRFCSSPRLRLRTRIRIITMPMGNSMPMISSLAISKEAADTSHASTTSSSKCMVVDAHSIPGLTLESAIPQICQAVPMALSEDEIMIRQQIASKVQMTMGKNILHFEGDIDPQDGTIHIDWDIAPIDPNSNERIQSHAIFRTYSEHTYVTEEESKEEENHYRMQTGEAITTRSATTSRDKNISKKPPTFCYLLGCEPIDLCALMQHTLDINTGKVKPTHEYDFAARTNFCGTFNICTVVPFDPPMSQKEIQQMQQELDVFRGGIASYIMEEAAAKNDGRKPVHEGHMYMPSVLRHLPDISSMVRLQQGFQQVYCSKLVRSSDLILPESNAMAFVASGTCLQPHGMNVCFNDTTDIMTSRVATMHPTHVAIQMYSAMCNMGMSFQDFAKMKDPEQIFKFLRATFAAGTQDAVQCAYKSDYVLHSVTPVSREVAVANLQPVPAQNIVYAPGCGACFYKEHILGNGEKTYTRYFMTFLRLFVVCFYKEYTKNSDSNVDFCRSNLIMSEDQRQIMTGYSTHENMAEDDCETQGDVAGATRKGLMRIHEMLSTSGVIFACEKQRNHTCMRSITDLMQSLAENDCEILNKMVCPKMFSGHSKEERLLFGACMANLVQHVGSDIQVVKITGNAYAPEASQAANNNNGGSKSAVVGHCYSGLEARIIDMRASRKNGVTTKQTFKAIIEGTKFVNMHYACSSSSSSSSGKKKKGFFFPTDPEVLTILNQCSTLLGEITKLGSMDPTDDQVSSRLEVCPDKQGAKSAFYARAHVIGSKCMMMQKIPGVQGSPLELGVPVSHYTSNAVVGIVSKDVGYGLLATHLQRAGLKNVTAEMIKGRVMQMAEADGIPEWTEATWQKNVFDRYVPCGTLYENEEALKLFCNGQCMEDGYCPIVFMHECNKDRIRLKDHGDNIHPAAKDFVKTILGVLHEGMEPPVTHLHAKRILEVPPYKGMDASTMKDVKTFDAAKLNASIKGSLKGLIKVARISTQMGCLTTLCVVKVTDLPKLNNVLVSWAKPIVAAQQLKAHVGLQWRMKLEGINNNNNKAKP